VQYHGGADAPDIVCPDLNRWHWEGKFCETARIRDWLAQVEADRAGKPWVIAWKRRHGPWLAVLTLDDLLDILRDALPPKATPAIVAPQFSIPLSAPLPAPRSVASAEELLNATATEKTGPEHETE
jgi:hypothetical protein